MTLSLEAIQQCLIRVEQLGPYRNVDDRPRGCHCHAPSAFPGDRTPLSSAIAMSFWHTKWYKVGQNRLSEVQSQPDIPRSATPYLSTQHFHLHQDLRQLRHLRHQLLTPASRLATWGIEEREGCWRRRGDSREEKWGGKPLCNCFPWVRSRSRSESEFRKEMYGSEIRQGVQHAGCRMEEMWDRLGELDR